jgi:two-component system, probable response regulator PhcQ
MNVKGTVLVVDDEPVVGSSIRGVLEKSGYRVVTAESGDEALLLLASEQIEVIISDQMMPGMTGVDLLKLVRVRHPLVVRIMLTGETDPELPVRSINEGEVYKFLRKPWDNRELRTVVSLAFEVARLEQQKRHLIALLRNQLASPQDPADVEAEILRLAEDEIEGE